jgi:hypothetical protein
VGLAVDPVADFVGGHGVSIQFKCNHRGTEAQRSSRAVPL